MRYVARAPLRIDFGGGWTDVPIYAEREGGAVLNAAITCYARGSISRPEGIGLLRGLRSDRSYVSYSLDAPVGAGLGGSAAQTVVWAALVRTAMLNTASRRDIAEIAWGVGGLLGILGGKQDEYASALGGINFLSFGRDVNIETLSLPPTILNDLRERLVLAYSGERRLSSDVHATVWERYTRGDPRVAGALGQLKRVASDMKTALVRGDLDVFGSLLDENWTHQKVLAPSISSPGIEAILQCARANGAEAGKACGAGGGGCVLLMAGNGRKPQLVEALRRGRVPIIDFDFDTYGVFLKKG